jgi:UDP-N-acetylmuramate:L-alanyl-gamma-D-glutamyl-meso-diaminopimelate ligase
MDKPNLEAILNKDNARIYFVGIGGIAMSAAANILKAYGFEISGSDCKGIYDPAKKILADNKIRYFTGYDANNVTYAAADLYVLSAGEGLENPEVKTIVEKNLPRSSFSELLYELAKDKLRIVVAGTHGKSTTAGLLGHAVKSLDNSSFLVGGVLQNENANFHYGDGHYFVFEGDEYKSQFDDLTPKFIYYKPDILILTNLEYDHPDLFTDFQALKNEFALLVANMPHDGLIVYNADDAELVKLVRESNVASVSFGIDNLADYQIQAINYEPDYTSFSVECRFNKNSIAKLLGETEDYKIQLPGKLNVYNSLAVIATLRALGFTRHELVSELLSFKGIKRRFEIVGEKQGITIIDDYAHHPTAIKETLAAAKLRYFPHPPFDSPPFQGGERSGIPQKSRRDFRGAPRGGKLWAVFEPHTFSRTKATLPDLAKAFDDADEVLISEIYPARESAKDATITSDKVVAEIKSKILNPKSQIRKVRNKDEALNILKAETKPGDVVIVMAVGDFNRLAYELKDVL